MLINTLLYAVLIFMIIRMFIMSKQTKKNKKLIDVVNSITDKDEFFQNCDEMIATIQDPLFENKARIVKLWGMTYYHEYDAFEELLKEIDIDTMYDAKTGSISANEDSFFYMYLATPSMLYGDEREDLRIAVKNKMEPYNERNKEQLIAAIGNNCNKFFENQDDRGEEFFRKVIDGDYAGYKYSKNLIGLYKMICNATLAKIYEDKGEDTEELTSLIRRFADTGVGKRWFRAIGLDYEKYLPKDETEPEEEPEDIEEMTEENSEEE